MNKTDRVSDVVDWRLCLGCGACAYWVGARSIAMVDVASEGLRPVALAPEVDRVPELNRFCPGLGVDHTGYVGRPGTIQEVEKSFGPVLEIWEGHAADPEIRFKGSSGGALTALSLFCLNEGGMTGVLHIGQDTQVPTRNSVRLSRNRSELMACAGSRYAPAALCERLDLVENASGPCAIVAQPSEVAALRNLEALKPELSRKIGLVMSFFCAGSPPTNATLELLRTLKVPAEDLDTLRYRGHGWPGMFTTTQRSAPTPVEHMTYQESWAFLQKFRAYSTHLFPDGSGEGADISCGDPWYRPVEKGEHGSSLIVVRTARGREVLRRAIEAGYIVAKPATPEQLARSQANLTSKRGAIWGRLLAFRTLGIPTPRHRGLALFHHWLRLPFREKYKSVFGTMNRAWQRGYRRRQASIPRPAGGDR